uniref:Rab-GAP TBC domain-containing protein n=1 Tax=Heterorhabditis bacteriophora TaxID=37862 RepID=A0A1I7XRP2_HETBA
MMISSGDWILNDVLQKCMQFALALYVVQSLVEKHIGYCALWQLQLSGLCPKVWIRELRQLFIENAAMLWDMCVQMEDLVLKRSAFSDKEKIEAIECRDLLF